MKNMVRMRPINGGPSPRRDTGTFIVFVVLVLLFAALAVTQIILSLYFPQHATALATTITPFIMVVILLLGFAIGNMLR